MYLSELLFNSIDNEELIEHLQPSDLGKHLHDIIFEPLPLPDEKYNNNANLDVNTFYERARNLIVLLCEYKFIDSKFIDSISSLKVNSFPLLSFNIRSIPTNFQQSTDTVLSSTDIDF